MAAYIYKASTIDGKIVEGTMEAADNGAASLKLHDMGLLPIRVGPAGGRSALNREIEWPWKRKRRVRRKDLLVFTQELHTLVAAGFPLDRTLSVLGQLAESPALSEVIQGVLKEVKGGKSFSEGLGKYPEVFPKVYANMVKAGEVGGALQEVLGRLAQFLETSENLRSYIVGALIYPALLSVVGIASVTILTLFVVPRFASIFQDMGLPLPLPMAILKGLSDFLMQLLVAGDHRGGAGDLLPEALPFQPRRPPEDGTAGCCALPCWGKCCARSRWRASPGRSERSCTAASRCCRE